MCINMMTHKYEKVLVLNILMQGWYVIVYNQTYAFQEQKEKHEDLLHLEEVQVEKSDTFRAIVVLKFSCLCFD